MRRPNVDDETFVRLVDSEFRGAVAAAMMIVGSHSMAEEIVQDVLERTYGRWAKVSAMDRPGAWVRRAVINQAISTSRRQSTERRAMQRLIGDFSMGGSDVDLVGAESGSAVNSELWAMVRLLPESQATAVALHYGADLSLESIANEMTLSVSAVKSLLHRARTHLRETLNMEEALQ